MHALVAAACALALAGGCGFRPAGVSDDARPADAATADTPHGGSDARIDGSIDASVDAAIDAGPSASARAAAELSLGAGRVTVGTITVDVQLSPGPQVTHVTAGSISIDGAPAIVK